VVLPSNFCSKANNSGVQAERPLLQ
jgi:hypothetical protein